MDRPAKGIRTIPNQQGQKRSLISFNVICSTSISISYVRNIVSFNFSIQCSIRFTDMTPSGRIPLSRRKQMSPYAADLLRLVRGIHRSEVLGRVGGPLIPNSVARSQALKESLVFRGRRGCSTQHMFQWVKVRSSIPKCEGEIQIFKNQDVYQRLSEPFLVLTFRYLRSAD